YGLTPAIDHAVVAQEIIQVAAAGRGRPIDPDHSRSHVGQQHATERSRAYPGKFENGEMRKWAGHGLNTCGCTFATYIRLATSSSITSVAPPPIVRTRASRAIRSTGVPMM